MGSRRAEVTGEEWSDACCGNIPKPISFVSLASKAFLEYRLGRAECGTAWSWESVLGLFCVTVFFMSRGKY